MRRLRAAAAALLCAALLSSCANPAVFSDGERLTSQKKRNSDAAVTFNYSDGAVEPPSSYNTYSNQISDFSLKLLRSRAKKETESFVFSPAASALQLSLLANGANAETRREILRALCGSEITVDDLNTCSSYFKSRLEAVSRLDQKQKPAEKVRLDSALLVSDSVDVKSSFLQTAADYYGCDVYRYSFKGEHAADKLNDRFSQYTNDCGFDPAASGTFSAVLATEITDSWLSPCTKPESGVFHGKNGDSSAEFITSAEKKIQSGKATGVVKYTAKNPLKLLLIMPNDPKSFESYVSAFDSAELNALLDSVDVTKDTAASIPSFTIEGGGKAKPLSEALAESGLYSLFTDKAGFSAFSFTGKAKPGEIAEITPQFRLDCNGINAAKEAEAAAAPVKAADSLSFDRPFLFLLVDNESNLPVLAGVHN